MHTVLLSALLSVCAGEAAAPDIVAVCPSQFREAMQPWLERRTKQGHAVKFVSNLGTADEIRDQIRGTAKSGKGGRGGV